MLFTMAQRGGLKLSKYNFTGFFKIMGENEIKMHVVPESERENQVHPDDDYDYHTYRILLLLRICGIKKENYFDSPTIYGRQKFAFYDFLIRNPFFLKKVIQIKNKKDLEKKLVLKSYENEEAFSSMKKYIRGPWDHRYEEIFNYMVSKGLVTVDFNNYTKSNKALCISLTKLGVEVADKIKKEELEWEKRMGIINALFQKNTTPESIESFILDHFPSLVIGSAGENNIIH
jgi:hypothetical protein